VLIDMGSSDPIATKRLAATRLSVGSGFRKETIVGMRRNGRDAPMD